MMCVHVLDRLATFLDHFRSAGLRFHARGSDFGAKLTRKYSENAWKINKSSAFRPCAPNLAAASYRMMYVHALDRFATFSECCHVLLLHLRYHG